MKQSLFGISLLLLRYSPLCSCSRPGSAHAAFGESEQSEKMPGADEKEEWPETEAYAGSLVQQLRSTRTKPRHLVGGVFMAARTVFLGGLATFVASVGTPLAATWALVASKRTENRLAGTGGGYVLSLFGGLVGGGLFGGMSAIPIVLFAVVRAVTNLYDGLVATPDYLKALIVQRRVWNPHERVWKDRRQTLEGERRELLRRLEEQEAEAARKRRNMDVTDTRLYDVLEVSPDASRSGIKKAYFAKARETHPDKNRDDPRAHENFVELHDAYSILSDDAKRNEYDRWGSAPGGGGGDGGGAARVLPRGFDAGLFVAVLFSGEGEVSSPTVENYVGDLGLATLLDKGYKILSLVESASIMKQGGVTDENVAKFARELFEGEGGDLREARRTAEIATHLVGRARALSDYYAQGGTGDTKPEALFREDVRAEARQILAESSFYGATYLEFIGAALSQALGMVPGDATYRKWATRKAFLRTAYEAGIRLGPLVEAAEDGTLAPAVLLPDVLKFVDLLNRADIATALRGAVWKALHDPGASRRDLRLRRRALRIIGQEFSALAAAEGRDARTARDLAANFELAFRLALKVD